MNADADANADAGMPMPRFPNGQVQTSNNLHVISFENQPDNLAELQTLKRSSLPSGSSLKAWKDL